MSRPMIKRFQIEDLISQDLSGVVFRALDTQSGNPVAVRRFFPYGADGGGLDKEEQSAYEIALDRLAGLKHPALRSVISGACDPVDRMPFIVTEWIEGEALAAYIAENGFSAESAILLITQALEVCELFSHVLAEEAIWVETNPQTIIVGGPESGRGFTFWISPLKWLGGSEEGRGMEAIVTLGEQVMGWSGRVISDQSGGGLGGWLKWLRRNAATTTLQEARASLAALTGAEPPPPVALLVAKASEPPTWKAPSKAPLIVSLVLGLLVAVLAIVFVVTRDASAGSAGPAVAASEEAPAKADKSDKSKKSKKRGKAAKATVPPSPLQTDPATPASEPVPLQWDDHDALVANKNNQVSVEGTAKSVTLSSSEKTIYLVFSSKEDRNAAQAGIELGKSSKEEMTKQLEPFIGKKIRVTGKVRVLTFQGLTRPDIEMSDLSAVEVIK